MAIKGILMIERLSIEKNFGLPLNVRFQGQLFKIWRKLSNYRFNAGTIKSFGGFMFNAFQARTTVCTNTSYDDQFDPIPLISNGQMDLQHIDCAGGRCALKEEPFKDRLGTKHDGYKLLCLVCGEDSNVVSRQPLVQQIRRAVLFGETTCIEGWIEMHGTKKNAGVPDENETGSTALPAQPQVFCIHFVDGSSRELVAARFVLHEGRGGGVQFFDVGNDVIASYASGTVQGVEAVRAYPRDDASQVTPSK
jgi:hypothetical protein